MQPRKLLLAGDLWRQVARGVASRLRLEYGGGGADFVAG